MLCFKKKVKALRISINSAATCYVTNFIRCLVYILCSVVVYIVPRLTVCTSAVQRSRVRSLVVFCLQVAEVIVAFLLRHKLVTTREEFQR